MKAKLISVAVLFAVFLTQANFAQTLPAKIKSYLNKNYKGWKLVKDKCYPNEPGKAVVTGHFNGDKKLDYAVKFARGKKGFVFAFLALKRGYKPFLLHRYDDIKYLKGTDLGVWEKGERYEMGGNNVNVRYDAVSDFQCESDVGGIHLYRNGKFITY